MFRQTLNEPHRHGLPNKANKRVKRTFFGSRANLFCHVRQCVDIIFTISHGDECHLINLTID